MLRVLAIDCSPNGPGRTHRCLEAVLAGAEEIGAETRIVSVGSADGAVDVGAAEAALRDADAFVFGTPTYRAAYAWPFKELVDRVPRGFPGEDAAPLTGRAVATVATAASAHHFLGLSTMRDILVDFFAAHVVSPGLYAPRDSFDEDGALLPEEDARARLLGRGVVELARAIATSSALAAARPLV
jgi:FMN reductase